MAIRNRTIALGVLALTSAVAFGQTDDMTEEQIVARIQELQAKLGEIRGQDADQSASEAPEAKVAEKAPEKGIVLHDGAGGTWKVGGAMRANYVLGDYDTGSGPGRGGHGGDFSLDTFRINVDYANGPWLGKGEYRWYNGYNFFHTLYGGYLFDDDSTLKVGLTRVPFGLGAYAAANSWFFDQHYYVGLSDNMNVGATYSTVSGKWNLDFGAYLSSAPNWRGASKDSARYSYNIVDTGAPNAHYRERGQLNARAIYSLDTALPTDIGVSLQLGKLKADPRFANDSSAWAAAIHTKSSLNNWGLKTQLTYYNYDADYNGMDASDNALIAMGAYDYAAPVASKAWIPSVALDYTWSPEVSWIDSITFYNDYSIILKPDSAADGSDLNSSAMNVLGAAFARDGWYVYVDYAYSNGNYFVGDSGDFGANLNNKWQGRFNVNFGFYF